MEWVGNAFMTGIREDVQGVGHGLCQGMPVQGLRKIMKSMRFELRAPECEAQGLNALHGRCLRSPCFFSHIRKYLKFFMRFSGPAERL